MDAVRALFSEIAAQDQSIDCKAARTSEWFSKVLEKAENYCTHQVMVKSKGSLFNKVRTVFGREAIEMKFIEFAKSTDSATIDDAKLFRTSWWLISAEHKSSAQAVATKYICHLRSQTIDLALGDGPSAKVFSCRNRSESHVHQDQLQRCRSRMPSVFRHRSRGKGTKRKCVTRSCIHRSSCRGESQDVSIGGTISHV